MSEPTDFSRPVTPLTGSYSGRAGSTWAACSSPDSMLSASRPAVSVVRSTALDARPLVDSARLAAPDDRGQNSNPPARIVEQNEPPANWRPCKRPSMAIGHSCLVPLSVVGAGELCLKRRNAQWPKYFRADRAAGA